MAVRIYRAVRIVPYQLRVPDDARELDALQEADEEFAEQLNTDRFMRHCYLKYRQHTFTAEMKSLSPVRTVLRCIVRGLKLRAKFAILQKERLCRNTNSMINMNDDEKEGVIRLVIGQVINSHRLLRIFQDDYPDVSQAVSTLRELMLQHQQHVFTGVDIVTDEEDNNEN